MEYSRHLKNILMYKPDLLSGKILDLGAGRGKFLIEMARCKADAVGLEYNPNYIVIAKERARDEGLTLRMIEGRAEALPFGANEFDFINAAEVIEHVEDPGAMLREMNRVMKAGARAYLSIPNRFGFKDPHFHMYGLNWVPRAWSDAMIAIMGKSKKYTREAGYQRLRDMHYFTYGGISRLLRFSGFEFMDTKEIKIRKRFGNHFIRAIVLTMYRLILRPAYFDALHLILSKSEMKH